MQAELFDIAELLTDIPNLNLKAGDRGAIVEKYSDRDYEIEFTNEDGETTALCTLPFHQFIIVWQTKTQKWVSLSDRIAAIVQKLSQEKQQEVFTLTRSFCKDLV
jgi:hypothetical protein